MLVVSHDINGRGRALEIVSPVLKSLENGKQLLIMGVVVKL